MKIIKSSPLSMTVIATSIFWVCCVYFHYNNSSLANGFKTDNNSTSVCYNIDLELPDDEKANNFVTEEPVSKTNNDLNVLNCVSPAQPFLPHWQPPRII